MWKRMTDQPESCVRTEVINMGVFKQPTSFQLPNKPPPMMSSIPLFFPELKRDDLFLPPEKKLSQLTK